jgi:hypothetical protein
LLAATLPQFIDPSVEEDRGHCRGGDQLRIALLRERSAAKSNHAGYSSVQILKDLAQGSVLGFAECKFA